MPISFDNYVDIFSGIIGDAVVAERQLITRIFSINPLIPANSYAEFSSAADVEAYFGAASVEYAMASFYFSFLSKVNTAPPLLSFASWVETPRAPMIYGAAAYTDTLVQLQAITAGALDMQLGASTLTLTGLDFAADSSLTAVAATLQAAIRAADADDPVVAGATVTFNPTSPLGAIFELTGGGTAGAGTVSVTPITSGPVDVGAAIGWEGVGAVVSQGSVAMSLTQTLTTSANASNNFGSFDFTIALTEAQILEIATWLATQNVMYMFLAAVTNTNAAAVSAAIINLPGVAMTLSLVAGQYPELIPGMILAAINYNAVNASVGYMYQQVAGVTPSVSDDADYETYNNLRVNYYGVTQEAGQPIAFYQRGILTGLASTSPTDMTVFGNEMWFKSYVGVQLLTALLTLNEIPTTAAGRATLLGILQAATELALSNGTITVLYEPLTPTQINAITQQSGSAVSYQQVQTAGYWIDVNFSSYTTQDGRTEYQANYNLIYTKNNIIRKVVGTHSLV